MKTLLWWLGYLLLVSVLNSIRVMVTGGPVPGDPYESGVQAGREFWDNFGAIVLVVGLVLHWFAAQAEWLSPPSGIVMGFVLLGILGNVGQRFRRSSEKSEMRRGFVTACGAKTSNRAVCECTYEFFAKNRTYQQLTNLMMDLGRGSEMSDATKEVLLAARDTCMSNPRATPTMQELINGTEPQHQQPLPKAAPGQGWRPTAAPVVAKAPAGPGEIPTISAKTPKWSATSQNGAAHLEQEPAGSGACRLSCTVSEKEQWQATGPCHGDSGDLPFVANDCERFIVFYDRPSGDRIQTTKFISIFDRTKVAWEVLGGGIITNEALRKGKTHLIRGMGGSSGQAPGYSADGNSVEFTGIDGKSQQVPLVKSR